MRCIELVKDGERIAIAGLPGKGVLSLIFDRVLSDNHGPNEDRRFTLGGLDTTTEPQTSVRWTGGKVEIGESFLVRFLDLDAADKPAHSEPSQLPTASELRRFRKRQLRHLEAEIKRVRKWLATSAPTPPVRDKARRGTSRKGGRPSRTRGTRRNR
jgi:hypothetical protein